MRPARTPHGCRAGEHRPVAHAGADRRRRGRGARGACSRSSTSRATRVEITLLTAGRFLTYRALSVAEPFGAEPPVRHEWGPIAADRGVRWIPDELTACGPDEHGVETRDGRPRVRYDALLLARRRPARAGRFPAR